MMMDGSANVGPSRGVSPVRANGMQGVDVLGGRQEGDSFVRDEPGEQEREQAPGARGGGPEGRGAP